MIFAVDAVKLFLPYITKVYGLPYSEDVIGIYFSVEDDTDVIGLRYKFSNTDYFKKMELEIRDKGFRIIDDTFESIIIVIDKDLVLKEASQTYLDGMFSKINMAVFTPYILSLRTKSVKEIKEEMIVKICSRSRELRDELEQELGVRLPTDAELGSLPNPEDFTFKTNF